VPSQPEAEDEQPDEVNARAIPSQRTETSEIEEKADGEESWVVSTKGMVQGSCIWRSCAVVFVSSVTSSSPVGADTPMLDTAGDFAASHIRPPKRTGYLRLMKRFFQLRCLA
jgi:hypothetical protein